MESKKGTRKCSRKSISIEVKQEIIKKSEKGVRNTVLAGEYNLHKNTIQTILNQKDKIKAVSSAGLNRVKVFNSVQRKPALDDVERTLADWVKNRWKKGKQSNRKMICDKAKLIFATLKKKSRTNAYVDNEEFKASRGWFEKFRKRSGIDDEMMYGNEEKSAKFTVESLNMDKGISVSGETGSLKKKDSNGTSISIEGNTMNVSFNEEDGESDEESSAPTVIVKEALILWEELKGIVESWHPNRTRVNEAMDKFDEDVMVYFKNLSKKRKITYSLDECSSSTSSNSRKMEIRYSPSPTNDKESN